MFMKRLTLALLTLALLFSCAACGENGDPSATTLGQPEEAQTYTAVLVDNRTGTPATAYYGYEGDTTPSAILLWPRSSASNSICSAPRSLRRRRGSFLAALLRSPHANRKRRCAACSTAYI